MTSAFTRPPKQRMRQQRNNSVVPAPGQDGGPDSTVDEAQLSVVPDEQDTTAAPDDDRAEGTDPAEATEAAQEATQGPDNTDGDDEPQTPDAETDTAADAAEESPPAPAEDVPAEPAPDTSTPDTARDSASEPANEAAADTKSAPEPAPAPKSTSKNTTKGTKASSRKNTSSQAKTPATGQGTALAVIHPDGSVSVDQAVHLVDMRDVEGHTDPHALVDVLGSLREVGGSDLREQTTTAISAAITAAALDRQ